MEYVLTAEKSQHQQIRLQGIEYKSSMEFYCLLNDYINHLEHNAINIEDIVFRGQVIVPKQEIRKMYYEDYVSMPWLKG